MREMRVADLPDYRETMVTVGNNSTIRLRKQVYSVPSRLIGVKLLARMYENRIVLLHGPAEVAQLPLGRSDRGAVIDFRHLIGHLLRKPGAFANYRWREELFPTPVYRATYDHLERSSPAEADRRYLEILKLAAFGRELMLRHGKRVLFRPTFKLVGKLLAAKRDLRLESEHKKLDRYDVLILDDIGYVQQSREEMDVLFTQLAERYERKSLQISSNLVFSQWDQIFKDPLTTMAAIDRLVHHSNILEFDGASQRIKKAAESTGKSAD